IVGDRASVSMLAVDGDYEMVEVGLGIAVFLFLPECHIKSGHVVVDIFTNGLSAPTRARLDAMGEVLFAAAAIVMIWQLWLGGMDAFDYEEQSMILELPLWIVFVPGVIANVIILLNSIDRFSRMIAGERV
ncbi:MAG: TRAP transporter small permease, partial [Oceanobacter sp.]